MTTINYDNRTLTSLSYKRYHYVSFMWELTVFNRSH